MTPNEYKVWLAQYVRGDEARRFLASIIGSDRRQDLDDILQDGFVGLLKTIENRSPDHPFDFPFGPGAYTKKALERAMLRQVQGARKQQTTSLSAGFGGANDSDADSMFEWELEHVNPTLPAGVDPQQVLDRIALGIREAVYASDRAFCPGCGEDALMSLCLCIVDQARDELDVYQADDEPDRMSPGRLPRTDALGSSIYRAIARVKGDGYVFDADSHITRSAKQLQHRCRPCVGQIVDDVVQWIVEARTDWSPRSEEGTR